MSRTYSDPSATPPTLDQQELNVLAWMHEYTLECGMPPSRPEIKARFNYSTVARLLRVLQSLRVKGYLDIPGMGARDAKVTPKGRAYLASQGRLKETSDATEEG